MNLIIIHIKRLARKIGWQLPANAGLLVLCVVFFYYHSHGQPQQSKDSAGNSGSSTTVEAHSRVEKDHAMLPERWRGTFAKDLMMIIVGVLCSTLAAFLLDSMTAARLYKTTDSKRRRLMALLGIQKTSSLTLEAPEVLVILPGYGSYQASHKPQLTDKWQTVCDKGPDSDNNFGSVSDYKAVSRIVAMFADAGFAPPKIRADSASDLDQLTQASSKIKCIISVGLFSNEFLINKVLRRPDPPALLAIQRRQSAQGSVETRIWGAEPLSPGANVPDDYLGSHPEQHVTVLARTLHNGKTLLVLGGERCDGTVVVARWLRQNWERINDDVSTSDNSTSVEDREFTYHQIFRKDPSERPLPVSKKLVVGNHLRP